MRYDITFHFNNFSFFSLKHFFSSTDSDGRGRFLASSRWQAGVYKLYFDTDAYFKTKQVTGFYPYVEVSIVRYTIFNTCDTSKAPICQIGRFPSLNREND